MSAQFSDAFLTNVRDYLDAECDWYGMDEDHTLPHLRAALEAATARSSLVVIDPEDREQVERFMRTYWRAFGTEKAMEPRIRMVVPKAQAALREFASPTPPRIDEPGTWGVVEASCVHSEERRKWARHDDGNWYPMGPVGREAGLPDDWESLKSPVLIREGVH